MRPNPYSSLKRIRTLSEYTVNKQIISYATAQSQSWRHLFCTIQKSLIQLIYFSRHNMFQSSHPWTWSLKSQAFTHTFVLLWQERWVKLQWDPSNYLKFSLITIIHKVSLSCLTITSFKKTSPTDPNDIKITLFCDPLHLVFSINHTSFQSTLEIQSNLQ